MYRNFEIFQLCKRITFTIRFPCRKENQIAETLILDIADYRIYHKTTDMICLESR